MKKPGDHFRKLVIVIFLLPALFHLSCGQKRIPDDMIGVWKTDTIGVSVRTKHETRGFEFTSGKAVIIIKIHDDHSVTGTIGSAKIEKGKIRPNWILPVKMSGLAFTIYCGKIGKIFENDPLDSKEVELWLPLPEKGTLNIGLRYTQGLAWYPMARGILTRED